MPRSDVKKSGSGRKIIISVLIAGAVITGVLLYWYSNWYNVNDEFFDQPALTKKPAAINLHGKEIVEEQKTAAVAAVSGKSVSGSITERPEYVSETEWQALQNVVKQRPNGSDRQLTNLVNKLLFIKKKKAFFAAGENTAQRKQLARQLLDMIPEQLEIEAIDSKTAKELEAKLQAAL